MEVFMKLSSLKRASFVIAIGLAALLGTSEIANAQDYRTYKQMQKQERKLQKQQRKLQRQQDRYNRMRYRVYQNGSYYDTDERGVQMLQQAVNYGYQQGFRAGQYDRSNRVSYGYSAQNMYRMGNYGYQGYVDQNQHQYYFQQGFQRGYQDGYNRRNQYGSNGRNILSTILSNILNIQQY